MASIGKMILKFEKLNVETILGSAIKDSQDDYINIQKEQMLVGEAKKGKIGKYRNLSYARRKESINPRAGFPNVDLKLTGAFQKALITKVSAGKISIKSTDSKAEGLVKKYGEKIFGLNKSHASEYSLEIIKPAFIKALKKKVF